MSKIITWVVLVGILAVGGYLTLNPKSPDSVDSTTQMETNLEETQNISAEPDASKKMAFSEFIKSGGAYKCTVSQNVSDVSSQGTVYIDGDKIKGEFNSSVGGLNVDSNLIVRDGYTYSWSSMTPNLGFKVKAQAPEAVDTATKTSDTYSFNAEQIGEYDCSPWAVDSKMFEIPSNVKFQELGV